MAAAATLLVRAEDPAQDGGLFHLNGVFVIGFTVLYFASTAIAELRLTFFLIGLSATLGPITFVSIPGFVFFITGLAAGVGLRSLFHAHGRPELPLLLVSLFTISYWVISRPMSNPATAAALALTLIPLGTFLLRWAIAMARPTRGMTVWLTLGLGVATASGLLEAFRTVGSNYSGYEHVRVFESAIGSSNYAAALAVVPAALALGVLRSSSARTKWLLAGLALPFAAAPLFLASRGATVALIVAFLSAMLSPKARRPVPAYLRYLAVGLTMTLLLTVAVNSNLFIVDRFLGSDVGSYGYSAGRTTLWLECLNLIAANPLFGVGPGVLTDIFLSTFQIQYAHNFLLEIWASLGLIGGTAYLWCLRPKPFRLWTTATPCIAAMVANSLVEPLISVPTGAWIFAATLGVHYAESRGNP